MRKNGKQGEDKNREIYCNACGRKLRIENDMVMEGVFPAELEWGYFSNKDGEIHAFDLCEECYDKWIATFKLPVEKSYKNELL